MSAAYALLLLCFFCSGLAALLYETAWAREFAFVFGTSELAVVSVLAAYMGGLAIGAALAGPLAARSRRPILLYGLLELAIAVFALLVPFAIRGVTWVYVALFGGLETLPAEGQLGGAIFYVAASFLILLPPTAAMGATLPLLARHAVRSEAEIGRRVGILYAVNTAGAIAGTLIAAFWLLPWLGLRQTVWAGAAINLLVFVLAALLARAAPARKSTAGAASATRLERHWVLPAIALSGLISFTYEILWFRLLGHVLGGSVSAFSTMLAGFLAGIALGSALGSRIATSASRARAGFAAAQLMAALLSLAAFGFVEQLPALALRLGAGTGGSLFGNALFAASMLLPAAVAIGVTFPCAVRLVARHPDQAAPATARVYAWNTLGAITGAIAAGFWLLPGLGYAGTLTWAAATNLLLAIGFALTLPRAKWLAGIPAAGLAALLVFPPPPPWALLRSSPFAAQPKEGEVAYYGVGRAATVLALETDRGWLLSTNGLPESTIEHPEETPGRFQLARWLGFLAAVANPEARTLLLIGLGGAGTLDAIPGTLEQIDVIELEAEVVAANREISTLSGVDRLADPRIRVHVNDARGALMLTDARWDAIVSQPSHPWTAGASHLYTREFFEIVREHLAPGGVFVQWIGLGFVDPPLLRSLVATLRAVFPAVRVYQPVPAGIIFLASEQPIDVEGQAAAALAAAPEDFARFGVFTPEDIAAALILDEEGSAAFGGGAINSDDRNQLAMASARFGAHGIQAGELRALIRALDPWIREDADRSAFDSIALMRRIQQVSGSRRARAIASAMSDPVERELSLGWLALADRKPKAAEAHFQRALASDSNSRLARFGLLQVHWGTLGSGPLDPEILEPLTRGQRATVLGHRAASRAQWQAVRAAEAALAEVDPRDPAFSEALRLRIGWRVALGGRERAEEALALADLFLTRAITPAVLLLRARAAIRAERPTAALSALEELAQRLDYRAQRARDLRNQALTLLRELPPSERAEAVRERFQARGPAPGRGPE